MKAIKTLGYQSKDILNFGFLEIVFAQHFMYNFLQKKDSHDIFFQLTKFHCHVVLA